MFIATLIAEALGADAPAEASRALAGIGAMAGTPRWIDAGVACDVPFGRATIAAARAVLEGLIPQADVIVQRAAGRAKRLLVADMDSTMITVECIDELADYAGIKPQVAAVTERAMRGELDFAAALDARVALLRGLGADMLDRCHAERVRIMPGAVALVRTLRANGARAVLVSGGFTAFADRVGAEIGFDRIVANVLDIRDEKLAGTVTRPIVGAAAKVETLVVERDAMGIAAGDVLAIGDGANDIPMIAAAGLGIAYHAKPRTAAAADARIDHNDLTAVLYALGIPRADWVV